MLAYTIFPSSKNPQGERFTDEYDTFLQEFAEAAPRATEKGDLAMWSPASFSEDRRALSAVEAVSMLVFDVDTESVSHASLAALPIGGFFHSTSSYRPDVPRWRLAVLLSRSVNAEEYSHCHGIVKSFLPFTTGKEAVDASRAWYVPREPDEGAYVFGRLDGEALDVEEMLAEARRGAIDQPREKPILQGKSNDSGRSLAAGMLALAWPAIGAGRDSAAKALCGGLLRAGWACAEVVDFMCDVAQRFGDEDRAKREKVANDLQGKLQDGSARVFGWPKLAELLGGPVVDAVRSTLKVTDSATPAFHALVARWAAEGIATPAPIAVGKSRKTTSDHIYRYKVGDMPTQEITLIDTAAAVGHLKTHAHWVGVLQYDVFAQRVHAVNPPIPLDAEGPGGLSNADIGRIRNWFQLALGGRLGKDDAFDSIVEVASSNGYHPVREYLLGLSLGGTSILNGLAQRIFGAQSEIENEMLRKFLIAAVRRIFQPGVKHDTILILKGKQGHKKSSFARALFGRWLAEDAFVDLKSKDALQGIQGWWGIEMAEVDKQIRLDQSVSKAFFSRTVDNFRPPYGKITISYPRSCVFLGTTNEDELLRDATGSRRYHIIEVLQQVDTAWVEANREAIWAAAVTLANAGEPHWFDDETPLEPGREAFIERDPWHELIEGLCSKEKEYVVSKDILAALINKDHWTSKEQRRVTDTLKRLGAKKGVKRIGERTQAVWFLPPTLCNRTEGNVIKGRFVR